MLSTDPGRIRLISLFLLICDCLYIFILLMHFMTVVFSVVVVVLPSPANILQ